MEKARPSPRPQRRVRVYHHFIPTTLLLLLVGSPIFAQESPPSMEEMWRIIQKQQAEIEVLQQQNESLRQRLDVDSSPAEVEPPPAVAEVNAPATVPAATPAVSEGDPQPANSAPASSMEIYGHAMLDMGYRSGQVDPDWFDVMRPTKLPSYKGEFGDDGDFSASVRQSRMGIRTLTPTRFGDLKTIFEFELFGVGADAGQTTFRLRHAWGEVGNFGAGQTWSAFMDIDAFPNSLEYWGPNGMVFYRNIQARWTPWSDGDSRFAISLENPGASGDGGKFADRVELENVRGDFEIPDLAAHYRWADDWGHVQLAGILRKIKWNDLNDDEFDLSGDETGWGLNLSGNYRIGPHVLRGSLVYGEGIQNYMNDASVDIGVVENFTDPVRPIYGKTIPLFGIVAFLDLNWSDEWTSTIGYSMQDNDLPSGQTDQSFKKGQYALANVLWHPLPNVLIGPELQWIKRQNFRDGFSADDLRIQVSAKWNFSHAFQFD